MLFPTLVDLRHEHVDLDLEARKRPKRRAEKGNPLLDPEKCQRFVSGYHKRRGIFFSHGGHLEHRGVLWEESYLDEGRKYIHLGVDCNVPAGTPVAVGRDCRVLRIDNDHPEPFGWGTRIFIQEHEHQDPDLPRAVLLFAHLDPRIQVEVGNELIAGTIIGKVGKPPFNGGWYSHLHLQMIERGHYEDLVTNDLRDLDGYAGEDEDLDVLEDLYPHPWNYVSL